MDTLMLYADDTYLFNTIAKITDIVRVGGLSDVFFDRTIFYPQGGGQPSDTGTVTVGSHEYSVTAVGYRDGTVVHTIPGIDAGSDHVGAEVSLRIEESVRLRNAMLHSGGHLISHILETLSPSLLPIKGYHFPDGSYVEMIDNERLGNGEMLDEANALLEDAILQNLSIKSAPATYEEIASLRPYLAVNVPKDKPTRIVTIGDFKAVPCGGTHVSSTKELAGLTITRIKRKKDRLKISYQNS